MIDYNVKDKYGGFIPTSFLSYNHLANSPERKEWLKKLNDLLGDEQPIRKVNSGNVKKRGGGCFAKDYDLSKVNPLLAEFLLKKFTKENDYVFDPFLNRGEFGIIANVMKRNFLGTDISSLYADFVNTRFAELKEQKNELIQPSYKFEAKVLDAIEMDGIEDNSFDVILTSPPYWYTEIYDDVPGELSHIKTYDEFIEQYAKHIKRCYSVVKPFDEENYEHFFISVTGNFRWKGRVVPFSTHHQLLCLEAGFKLWEDMVYVRKEGATVFTYKREEKMKRVSRVHETISIFVKK